MKKIFTACLFAGILIFVISCSKEKNKNENSQQPAQTLFEQQTIKAIRDFKQKVAYYRENPGYKSGETVIADSAMFLLEGTINYSHAFMMDRYNEEVIESLTLIVPKTGSVEVDMDVLVQKYEEMKTEITTLYYNSNFENKGLVAVDLSEVAQNNDEITFNVDVITGNHSNDPPPPGPGVSGPFVAGDNWWYGENEGKCYDTTTYSDAAQELKTAMSDYIYQYNQNNGIYMFYPVEVHYFYGGQKALRRYNDVKDNHLDYYMFNAWDYIGISDDTLCVEWTEMNIYYSYLKYWLYTKMKDSIQSQSGYCYQPAQIFYIDGYHEESGHYIHDGYFLFGFPWYSDEGEGPVEL